MLSATKSDPTPIRRRCWITCAMVLAVIGSATGMSTISSAALPGTPGYIGLTQPYTYHPGCGGIPVDPLNVVWFGTYATTTHVTATLSQIGGWSHNDYQSPFGVFGVDTQAVKETAASGDCTRDHVQNANHCSICVRDHIRLFPTAANSAQYVTGDAHHEALASFVSGCSQGLVAGHYSSDFNGPRDRIKDFWPGGIIHYDNWANTRRLKQCNGSRPFSDGRVAVMRAANLG